ncbi:Type II secretion system protein F [Aquicella siphonis]|uniref:Type II secretion system protein F n=1 Tax=Aquicella siphonis TaxID=254247 RepID=A0A5E4PEE5_9COXI|nr:type II secretion system F family protein [Aquicella siphonis]VVC75340.1 Type II secretion system protein F [Aquicella siphonis]
MNFKRFPDAGIGFSRHGGRITARENAVFLRQLAALLTAGIPIILCCEILEQSQTRPVMRALIFSIRRELLAGRDFYHSLRCQQGVFDELTCQMVKIGEHTGRLDSLLCRVADEKEKALALQTQIRQTLFYPGIIMVTALLVTLGMFLVVIPRFAELFAGSQAALPLLTRGIFYLSSSLRQHGFILLLSAPCVALALVLIPHPACAAFKNAVWQRLLRLPLVHKEIRQLLLVRFTRNLSITLSAGLSLSEGLRLALYSNQHAEFARSLAQLRGCIHSGLQLHQAMRACPGFPEVLVQMVKIGEESGTPEQMLARAADFFEAGIQRRISRLCLLLEPLIMLVLGVLIGGLVIGMYLPIFKLGNVL